MNAYIIKSLFDKEEAERYFQSKITEFKAWAQTETDEFYDASIRHIAEYERAKSIMQEVPIIKEGDSPQP